MRLSPPDTATPVDPDSVDLADPKLYGDGKPHSVWRVLREREPVRWQPVPGRGGFWSVTRYAHATQVMLDHETFSSTGGVFLNLLGRSEPAQGEQFASSDPPRHGKLRSPLQHRMTPAAVAQHVESIRQDVRDMLDAGTDREPFDLATALAPLPMVVLGPLLGIPRADWPRVSRLVLMSVAEEDPDYQLPDGAEATLGTARRELFSYLLNLVLRHLRAPRDNLISVLTTMEVDGQPLRPGAVVANMYSIVLGAAAAIPHVPAAAVLELCRQGRYPECATRPDVIPTLTEEALRWSAPAQHFMRMVTRPVRIAEVDVEPGQAVVVWLGAANRDAAAFPDPDAFDPWRTPNQHLAFGAGRHYCFGNSIARLALAVVFEELFARFSDIRLAGEVDHIRSTWLAGYKRVPLDVTPRRDTR